MKRVRLSVAMLMMVFCLLIVGCAQTKTEEPATPDTFVESGKTNENKLSSSNAKKEPATEEEIDQPATPDTFIEIDKPNENKPSSLTVEKEPATEEETEQLSKKDEMFVETKNETEEPIDTPVEKNYISVSSSKAAYNKEQLLEKGDLVVRVRLASKDAEEMVNPDGKAKDASGNLINNRLVTSYNAEVLEVYKGEYSEPYITIKTSEGYGLSADLLLHGEDEKFILDSPLKRFTLEAGKEYLLILVSVKGENKIASGYFIFGPETGCFTMDENGVWKNKRNITAVSFDEKMIQSEVDSIISEKNES